MSSDNPFGNDQTDVEESNPFSSSVSREEGIDISDAKEEFSGDKGKLEQDESPTQDSAGKSGDGTNVFGEISQGWTAQWDEATKMIEISHPKLNILVSAPEVVSSVMSKHVVYSVKTDPMGFSVRRRYNDFAWLRDTLAYKYEGLFIPSIPSTTMFTKNHVITTKTDVNGDFVKNRMSQLHLFMQQLCKIPFLRTDPSLQAFLSVQNEKEFKILVESCKNIMSDEEQSQGLVLWNTLITQNEVNADAERLITDFKRQLDSLRSMLNHLEAECKNAGKKADSCAKGLASVAEKISLWNELENNLLDPNRNEYVNLNGPKVKQYMSALEAGADHWFQNFCLLPKVIGRVVLSGIQYQQVQVDGFRNHLVFIESLVKDLEKAQKEKHKAIEEKAKASVNSSSHRSSIKIFGKGIEELEESLQKKTESVDALQATVSKVTKALIFCEIDRFNKERLQTTSYLLGSLAVTNMQISQISTSKWSQIVTSSGLDVSNFEGCLAGLQSSLDADIIFGDM